MPRMNFDLLDGLPPVSFDLTPDDAARFCAFMQECNEALQEKRRMAPEAFGEIFAEVKRATEKFPEWPDDPLHALAVLGEEFGELTKAVLQRTYEPHKRSTAAEIRNEAIQTAAMALRFVMSLDQYSYDPCQQHSQGVSTLSPGNLKTAIENLGRFEFGSDGQNEPGSFTCLCGTYKILHGSTAKCNRCGWEGPVKR